MGNVTNETLSEILYDLYNEIYGRVEPSYVVGVTDSCQFDTSAITKQEAWAYSTGIVYIGFDTVNINFILSMRNQELRSRTVVNSIFTPLYKLANQTKDIVYNKDLDKFIMDNNLCAGVCEDIEQFCNADTISNSKATRLAQNAKKFAEKYCIAKTSK